MRRVMLVAFLILGACGRTDVIVDFIPKIDVRKIQGLVHNNVGQIMAGGTGWIIKAPSTSRTFIVTAYHVVESSPEHKFLFWSEGTYKLVSAIVCRFNVDMDVAILVTDKLPVEGLEVRGENPSIGSAVLGAGVVYDGRRAQLPAQIMAGVVLEYKDGGADGTKLETSATMWFGFSGGAIIDPKTFGVVGLIQYKYMQSIPGVDTKHSKAGAGLCARDLNRWIKSQDEAGLN